MVLIAWSSPLLLSRAPFLLWCVCLSCAGQGMVDQCNPCRTQLQPKATISVELYLPCLRLWLRCGSLEAYLFLAKRRLTEATCLLAGRLFGTTWNHIAPLGATSRQGHAPSTSPRPFTLPSPRSRSAKGLRKPGGNIAAGGMSACLLLLQLPLFLSICMYPASPPCACATCPVFLYSPGLRRRASRYVDLGLGDVEDAWGDRNVTGLWGENRSAW